MILYDGMRKINRYFKQNKKRQAGKFLSPVRRIERVYPIKGQRLCAMTFDDGPSALPPNPPVGDGTVGLTQVLDDILSAFEAKGTFDVIGTTSENYPDKRGKIHSASWGGLKHDHYPDFEKDHLAGAVNQPQLIEALHTHGHQITNHGYHHVLYGKNKLVYGNRQTYKNLYDVVEDLWQLEACVSKVTQTPMKFARPPHYIDHIKDGYSAYDAYALMGYHYLAASFDGGGWMPSKGDYDQDVEAMVAPMRRALEEDPDALNGQIIFQKDGCNMSLETPIATALSKQLELLKSYGYKVVTVDELVRRSPFEDFGEGMDGFEAARDLDRAGLIVGYRNNSFQPDRKITVGELITMATPRDYYKMLREELFMEQNPKALNKVKYKASYAKNLTYVRSVGYMNRIKSINAASEVTMEFMVDFIGGIAKARDQKEVYLNEPVDTTYTRREAAIILAGVLLKD